MGNTNSNKGFRLGMMALLLIAFLLVVQVTLLKRAPTVIFGAIIGFGFFVCLILALIGLVFSVLGWREPNTTKKIAGLVCNLLLNIFFILSLVMSILDINKVFQ